MAIETTCVRAFALAAALSIGASGAQAQTIAAADPAIRYEVAEPDREGNVPLRRQPGAEGEIAGELAGDAGDLVLSGAAVLADDVRWVEVLREGGLWAEAARLRPQDEDPADDFPLLCTGTEPFWSVEIRAGEAVFTAPDVPTTQWEASDWLPARGLVGRYMIRLDGGYGTGHLALLRQTCFDGMSDLAYPFAAVMITPGEAVRAGCCRRASEALDGDERPGGE